MKNRNGFLKLLLTPRVRQGGFTLVEILVAAAMLGVVSLGVMQLTKNVTKTGKRMAQDSTAVQLRMEISQILQSQAACTNTLGGVMVDGNLQNVVGGVVDENGRQIAVPGQIIGGNPDVVGGGSQGALTIVSVQARGFVDPGPPITYNIANVQDAWGGANPGRLGLVSVRIMVRKGANNNLNADQLRDQSLGSDIFPIDFRVRASIPNAAGPAAIAACFGDQNAYVEAACNAIGGRIDNADGLCKEIRLRGTPLGFFDQGAPATIYQDLTTAGIETHGLHVDGFNNVTDNTVGPPPQAYPAAPGIAGGGLQVGPVILGNVPASGDATINRSLGVGLNAPAATGGQQPGSISAGGNVGIGVLAPINGANTGMLQVNRSIGVGVAPPIAAGDMTVNRDVLVNRSVGIGVAPSTNAGDLTVNRDTRVNRSVGIGVAPSGIAGNLTVNNDAAVTRDLIVSRHTTLGDQNADYINTNVRIRNNGALFGGRVQVEDLFRVQGATYRVDVDASGFLTTNATAANLGSYSSGNLQRYVTKEWVYSALSSTFTLAERQQIVGFILNNAPTNNYATLRDAIGDATHQAVRYGINGDCAANELVVGINAWTTTPLAGIDRINISPRCLDRASVCTTGLCLTAGTQAFTRRFRGDIYKGQHHTGSSVLNSVSQCYWYTGVAVSWYTSGSALTNRHHHRTCPYTYPVASGFRTYTYASSISNGFYILCCRMDIAR